MRIVSFQKSYTSIKAQLIFSWQSIFLLFILIPMAEGNGFDRLKVLANIATYIITETLLWKLMTKWQVFIIHAFPTSLSQLQCNYHQFLSSWKLERVINCVSHARTCLYHLWSLVLHVSCIHCTFLFFFLFFFYEYSSLLEQSTNDSNTFSPHALQVAAREEFELKMLHFLKFGHGKISSTLQKWVYKTFKKKQWKLN